MNASPPEPGRTRRPRRSLPIVAALLLIAALPLAAAAHPRRVENLDTAAWSQLRKSEGGPSAVVFSSTDCAHCPGVIALLSAQIQAHKRAGQRRARLIVVVMDGAGAELLEHAAYRPADRLFVFDSETPPAALRHAVDPRWRGVTPYVVLMDPAGITFKQAGPPTQDLLQRWLGAAGGSTAGPARP